MEGTKHSDHAMNFDSFISLWPLTSTIPKLLLLLRETMHITFEEAQVRHSQDTSDKLSYFCLCFSYLKAWRMPANNYIYTLIRLKFGNTYRPLKKLDTYSKQPSSISRCSPVQSIFCENSCEIQVVRLRAGLSIPEALGKLSIGGPLPT